MKLRVDANKYSFKKAHLSIRRCEESVYDDFEGLIFNSIKGTAQDILIEHDHFTFNRSFLSGWGFVSKSLGNETFFGAALRS
jgi:hypothetical protein